MEFQWKHIVIIVDESEASESLLRNNFAALMRQKDYELFPTYIEFDSRFHTPYKKILKDASKNARGMYFLYTLYLRNSDE